MPPGHRPGAAFGFQPLPEPPSPLALRNESRTGGLLATVLVLILVLGVATVGVVIVRSGHTVTSADGAVSVHVPTSWEVEAPTDAGEPYEEDGEQWRTPELEAYSLWGKGETMVEVHVLAEGRDQATEHEEQVAAMCAAPCAEAEEVQSIMIDGHHGSKQTLTYPAGFKIVVTLDYSDPGTSEDRVVQMIGYGFFQKDTDVLLKIINSVEVH